MKADAAQAVFQYFFMIAAGLGIGAILTFIPSYIGFRFLKNKLDQKGW